MKVVLILWQVSAFICTCTFSTWSGLFKGRSCLYTSQRGTTSHLPPPKSVSQLFLSTQVYHFTRFRWVTLTEYIHSYRLLGVTPKTSWHITPICHHCIVLFVCLFFPHTQMHGNGWKTGWGHRTQCTCIISRLNQNSIPRSTGLNVDTSPEWISRCIPLRQTKLGLLYNTSGYNGSTWGETDFEKNSLLCGMNTRPPEWQTDAVSKSRRY